jgi:hypothetical protein
LSDIGSSWTIESGFTHNALFLIVKFLVVTSQLSAISLHSLGESGVGAHHRGITSHAKTVSFFRIVTKGAFFDNGVGGITLVSSYDDKL